MKKILVVGGLTKDVIYYNGELLRIGIGGPPYYISKVLSFFKDIKVIIISTIGTDFPRWNLNEICQGNIECIIDKYRSNTIRFTNIYYNDRRTQLIDGYISKINLSLLESVGKIDYIIVSPVYGEIDKNLLTNVRKRYKLAVDPQGFMRMVRNKHVTLFKPDPGLFKGVDILKPAREEFKTLVNNSRDFMQLKNIVGGYIIITDGLNGSYLVKDVIYHIPAYKVERAEPTGAGDMFLGALVYYYLKYRNILNACSLSSATVSLILEGSNVDETIVRERSKEISKGINEISSIGSFLKNFYNR